jgi:hypothetical protein
MAPLHTLDGIEIHEGLRVHHPQRGAAMVMRVTHPDAVVVRWEAQLSEPGRTTFVEPGALTAVSYAQAA